MPSSRQAQMIRSAISPRLAMRIFRNMSSGRSGGPRRGGPDPEERLAELHRLAVRHQDVHHLAVDVRLDLVHQLHRLDDAHHLALADPIAGADERRGVRRTPPIEGLRETRLTVITI